MRDDIKVQQSGFFRGAMLVAAACALASFAARAESAGASPAASAAASSAASPTAASAAPIAPSAAPTAPPPAPMAAPAAPTVAKEAPAIQPPAPRPPQLTEQEVQQDIDDDEDLPEPPPPPPVAPPPAPAFPHARRRIVHAEHDARAGAIFSVGLGAAQQYLSGAGHSPGLGVDLRLGYGFSDRFQLFFDLGAIQPGQSDTTSSVSTWHLRAHGQTVLFGDRRGNGLNLNLGIGFGGVSTNGYTTPHDSSQLGVSLGGGLSYEFRISPRLAIAPELFASWQQVPNYGGLPADIAWSYGARVNVLWYSTF